MAVQKTRNGSYLVIYDVEKTAHLQQLKMMKIS